MSIRYINGKKYRFAPNARELQEVAELKAQLAVVEMSDAELADMVDGIDADKVDRAKARLIDAHNKNEQARIAKVQEEIAKWEHWFEQLRTKGQSAESLDNYPGWWTTRRG